MRSIVVAEVAILFSFAACGSKAVPSGAENAGGRGTEDASLSIDAGNDAGTVISDGGADGGSSNDGGTNDAGVDAGAGCGAGQHLCAGECVSNTSTATCGTSCSPCATRANATTTCDGTSCGFTCNTGFGDCDGVADNGCEKDVFVDPDNCGHCGRTCSSVNVALRICAFGLCYSTCQTPYGNCTQPNPNGADDGCETNLNSNAASCGACGRSCSDAGVDTLSCSGGTCNSTCVAPFANCAAPASPNPDDGCEVNVSTSAGNCGACGRACSMTNVATASCSGGLCNSACNPPFGNCSMPDAGGADDGCETNLASNTESCGACGRACSSSNVASLSCSGGLCNSTCSGTFGNCSMPDAGGADDGCETNLATSTVSCGGCGRACASTNVATLSCSAGVCDSSCIAPYANCAQPNAGAVDDGCETNLNTNTGSCGACGRACSNANVAALSCSGGTCNSSCNAPYANCGQPDAAVADDGCEINTDVNVDNCGACARACASTNVATRSCSAGTCNSTCTGLYRNCNQPDAAVSDDGCEKDTSADPANCGACGRACASTNVASLSCGAGLCNSTCNTPFGNCNQPDAGADDGCEVDLTTNVDNCGECARACSTTNVLARTCSNRACSSTCTGTYGNCNQADAGVDDGCEINLATNLDNCGACGRACSWDGGVAARSCTASVCNSTCEATRANCVKPNASLPDDGCESAATCGLPCTCSYVVVSAVADTQLRQDHPTFNYGASYAIWADQGASDSKTSLVRFDLGTIPTGASIVSAFLHIFVSDNDSGDVYTLHRVLEAWDEGDGGFAGAVVAGATWNQRQGGVPWTDRDGGCGPEGSCTADAGGSFKPNSTWTWFMPSVDSTWVHNWHNGTYVNYGLAIRSVIAGDDGVHFASKDAPDAGDFAGAGAYIDAGPRLEVWFVVP